MQSEDTSRPVEVFAGSSIQSGFIKSILEEAGLQVFLYNELMGNIYPGNLGADGFNPVKVMVSSEDRESALTRIRKFYNADSSEIPEE